MAAFAGHVGVVRQLLAASANPNKTTSSGGSPLYVAAQQGHLECAQLLLAKGMLLILMYK